MSTETPTTAEIRNRHNSTATDIDEKIELDQAFGRWLATVTPNPADERQVETVARELHDLTVTEHGGPCDTPDHWKVWIPTARAVLTALAALAGETR